MGCPRAAPESARPVNWHQRPRPHSRAGRPSGTLTLGPAAPSGGQRPRHASVHAGRQLARRPCGANSVRPRLPANWHQRLRLVVVSILILFLSPSPGSRRAALPKSTPPVNWHHRPVEPGRRRPAGTESLPQVPRLCQLAHRSSRSSLPGIAPGAARFAPSSPPALPRSLMGVFITNRAKVGLTLSDS